MWNWFSAACVVAALVFAPAYAQSRSLEGVWSFRATNDDIGCIIQGIATVTAAETRNVYDVRMRATESCGGVERTVADQACVATRARDRVSVRCAVVRVVPDQPYLPDDFDLRLRDSNTMSGVLTANWNAPAIWRRGSVSVAPVA